MKLNTIYSLLFSVMLLFSNEWLKAQTTATYSLQQLIDTAMKNNRLLSIKSWQVQEKISKLKEDKIKKYPSAQLEGNYQYNFKLAELSIPAGAIGVLPSGNGSSVLLPEEKRNFQLGEKSTYNVGANFYQPLTQQVKINTGLAIDRTDIELAEKDKQKLSLQLQQEIEKLYYGILITQKQMDEQQFRLDLTKSKLSDAQNALQAGQTISANISGLHAGIAEEEQKMMKLNIQTQDYMSELINITHIHADTLMLNSVAPPAPAIQALDAYQTAFASNPDMQIAGLNRQKALFGIKAARQSNLPDVGLVAGYYYQQGNPMLATSSPYLGIQFKWNLQDIFSNNTVLQQRQFQLKQAEENFAYTQQQLKSDIEKAWRKSNQARMLMDVAQKAVRYRKEDLKVQEDKQAAGMDVKTALLETRWRLAKSEVDLYSSQLSFILAVSELRHLTGLPGTNQ